MQAPLVHSVHRSAAHLFSKHTKACIDLLAGLGVDGDAHCGATVKHRYLTRRTPGAPNRMQVHLLGFEFLDDLTLVNEAFSGIAPGDFGENITTTHLDLISLPTGTCLHLGETAVVELTGLRSPCSQMNGLRPGLMKAAFLPGSRKPRAGVMAVVRNAGRVQAGDRIHVAIPSAPLSPLVPL